MSIGFDECCLQVWNRLCQESERRPKTKKSLQHRYQQVLDEMRSSPTFILEVEKIAAQHGLSGVGWQFSGLPEVAEAATERLCNWSLRKTAEHGSLRGADMKSAFVRGAIKWALLDEVRKGQRTQSIDMAFIPADEDTVNIEHDTDPAFLMDERDADADDETAEEVGFSSDYQSDPLLEEAARKYERSCAEPIEVWLKEVDPICTSPDTLPKYRLAYVLYQADTYLERTEVWAAVIFRLGAAMRLPSPLVEETAKRVSGLDRRLSRFGVSLLCRVVPGLPTDKTVTTALKKIDDRMRAYKADKPAAPASSPLALAKEGSLSTPGVRHAAAW